jgi:hypothetical protein
MPQFTTGGRRGCVYDSQVPLCPAGSAEGFNAVFLGTEIVAS